MDCSPPGSSVHGILQARIQWVAICFSRGSYQPRSRIQVSCIARRCFMLWATREALSLARYCYYPHFSDEATKMQKDQLTCPEPHSKSIVTFIFEPKQDDCRACSQQPCFVSFQVKRVSQSILTPKRTWKWSRVCEHLALGSTQNQNLNTTYLHPTLSHYLTAEFQSACWGVCCPVVWYKCLNSLCQFWQTNKCGWRGVWIFL